MSTTTRQRVGAWLAIGIGIIAVGTVGAVLTGVGQWSEHDALDPDSAAPDGTRALVHILEDQGIEVFVTSSHEDALARASESAATLVLPDVPALSDDTLDALVASASDVVFIDPRSRTLRRVSDDAHAVGIADDALTPPGCGLDGAQRSGGVRIGTVYAGSDVTGCYATAGGFGLLVADTADGRRVAIDATTVFTNASLAEDGNAALAINLMGRNETLIWYVPSAGDTDLAATDLSLGELTPPWVTPVIVLLLLAGLTAALWRGIRFGPLVAERLPVTVRAGEADEGRAHLYARTRDHAHAAALLRGGTTARVAHTLGLSATASAEAIADLLASLTELRREDIHDTLNGPPPSTDHALETLRARLEHLERAARAALQPERIDT